MARDGDTDSKVDKFLCTNICKYEHKEGRCYRVVSAGGRSIAAPLVHGVLVIIPVSPINGP